MPPGSNEGCIGTPTVTFDSAPGWRRRRARVAMGRSQARPAVAACAQACHTANTKSQCTFYHPPPPPPRHQPHPARLLTTCRASACMLGEPAAGRTRQTGTAPEPQRENGSERRCTLKACQLMKQRPPHQQRGCGHLRRRALGAKPRASLHRRPEAHPTRLNPPQASAEAVQNHFTAFSATPPQCRTPSHFPLTHSLRHRGACGRRYKTQTRVFAGHKTHTHTPAHDPATTRARRTRTKPPQPSTRATR
jgi:hypothetical protein